METVIAKFVEKYGNEYRPPLRVIREEFEPLLTSEVRTQIHNKILSYSFGEENYGLKAPIPLLTLGLLCGGKTHDLARLFLTTHWND